VEARILYAPHAALRRQFSRSRLATFLGEIRCGGFFFRWRAVISLAGSDIDDQLTELARVARALETTGYHAGNMALRAPIGNPAKRRRRGSQAEGADMPMSAEECRANAETCERMAQSLGPENAGLRDVMREVADQWHRLAADAEAKERYNSN
jgi:hypothetical protein